MQDDVCCPKFIPEPWDNKIIKWENKRFIKGKTFTIFYIPLNIGSAITKLTEKAEKIGAKSDNYLCLSECTSLWNMDLFLGVDKEVPGAENVTFNGTYFSKVYEGDFSKTGEWSKDFESTAKSKGFKIEKLYMWYTTCPKCAKKYGKNYTVILGKI